MAVFSALGATRGRIAAQLLVESLVLGTLGGAAGVGLAAVLIQVAAPLVPAIREAVGQLDPRLALADVRTMEEIWERSLSGLTEPVWLIGIFATVAARLAALGPVRRGGTHRHATATRATRVDPTTALRAA